MRLSFYFHQSFKADFVHDNAWVRFTLNYFFKDNLPRIHVGSHIIERVTVDLDVHGLVRWTI